MDEVEGASIIDESDTVGRNLAAILEESYSPRYDDDAEHAPFLHNREVAESEVAIPGESHEGVAQ